VGKIWEFSENFGKECSGVCTVFRDMVDRAAAVD